MLAESQKTSSADSDKKQFVSVVNKKENDEGAVMFIKQFLIDTLLIVDKLFIYSVCGTIFPTVISYETYLDDNCN